eukprot:SAG11_NODE_377_length_9984_cov_74.655438_2_plen_62_part_00
MCVVIVAVMEWDAEVGADVGALLLLTLLFQTCEVSNGLFNKDVTLRYVTCSITCRNTCRYY